MENLQGIFATDLDPDIARKPSGFVLTFIAMIPLDVAEPKREELLAVMKKLMQDLVLLQMPQEAANQK